MDPAKDLVRGSNHELFCLNGGLVVRAARGDATGICPIDAQLVSLEHPGLWRYTRDFVAHKPDVFVLMFDNVYSTNFGQWIEGSWSSRVRLWAIEDTGITISKAQGAVLGRGLLLTAFGRNPYGEGTLLRLWEQAGNAATCTIQLPTGMKARTAQFCNLRGETAGPSLPIAESGTFNLPIRPMAPTSVILLGPAKGN